MSFSSSNRRSRRPQPPLSSTHPAHAPIAVVEGRVFTIFTDLPVELQSKIWAIACCEIRVVKAKRRQDTRTKEYIISSPTLAPAVLHACSQSRKQGLKFYDRLTIAGTATASGPYINYARDYVQLTSFDADSFRMPDNHSDEEPGHSELYRKCRRLILQSGGLRLDSVLAFENLEELVVAKAICVAADEECVPGDRLPFHMAIPLGAQVDIIAWSKDLWASVHEERRRLTDAVPPIDWEETAAQLGRQKVELVSALEDEKFFNRREIDFTIETAHDTVLEIRRAVDKYQSLQKITVVNVASREWRRSVQMREGNDSLCPERSRCQDLNIQVHYITDSGLSLAFLRNNVHYSEHMPTRLILS